jgi:hypothetical protein
MELEIPSGRPRVGVDGRDLSPASTGSWLLPRTDASSVFVELPAGETATVRFRVIGSAGPD